MQREQIADNDTEKSVGYAKEYLNIKNHTRTLFKTLYQKKYTHYNHFNLRIDPIIYSNNHKFIFNDEKIYDLSNTFRNISIIMYGTNFNNIKKIKCSNKNDVCFDYTGEEILMMLSLDKNLYDKCIQNEYIIFPFNKLLFVDQCNVLYINKENTDLIIEIEFYNTIKKSFLIMDAYNLTSSESKRSFMMGHEYIINDYLFFDMELNEGINEKELFYDSMISSIVVEPYDKSIESDNLKISNLNISLDKMPFLSPDEYPFITVSETPNIVQNGNYYLTTDAPYYILSGKYICRSKKLIIKSNKSTKCKVMIKFYSHMMDCMRKTHNKTNEEILNNCSNYPLTKIDNNNFIEGYWKNILSSYPDNYPYPKVSDTKVSNEFINKLEQIMNCNNSSNIIKEEYFGFSYCRLCNCNNGGNEFIIKSNNITFRMPEGMIHYYINHNVQPSKEFYDFIMNFNLVEHE